MQLHKKHKASMGPNKKRLGHELGFKRFDWLLLPHATAALRPEWVLGQSAFLHQGFSTCGQHVFSITHACTV